jgi:hypothetical protein
LASMRNSINGTSIPFSSFERKGVNIRFFGISCLFYSITFTKLWLTFSFGKTLHDTCHVFKLCPCWFFTSSLFFLQRFLMPMLSFLFFNLKEKNVLLCDNIHPTIDNHVQYKCVSNAWMVYKICQDISTFFV